MSAPFEKFVSDACLTRTSWFAALILTALADLSDDPNTIAMRGTPGAHFLNLYHDWRRERLVRSDFLVILRELLCHPCVLDELEAFVLATLQTQSLSNHWLLSFGENCYEK